MNTKTSTNKNDHSWPELPTPAEWQDTLEAVHLWSQIVGKIRLEHMPWINHCWHVALYVSSRGLSTSLIPHKTDAFEIELNFTDHRLEIKKVNGQKRSFELKAMSVADFYA